MRQKRIKKIAYIGMFSALAAVAMVFKMPVPWAPTFYKMELSEVICLVGGFLLGAPAAVAIEAIKVLVNFLLDGTTTAGIGELSNFLMGCSFVVPATLVFHRKKTMDSAILGVVVGTVSLGVVSCLLNYFVLLPMYSEVFGLPMEVIIGMGTKIFPSISGMWSFVLICVLNFNLSKGIISSILGIVLYKLLPERSKGLLSEK